MPPQMFPYVSKMQVVYIQGMPVKANCGLSKFIETRVSNINRA